MRAGTRGANRSVAVGPAVGRGLVTEAMEASGSLRSLTPKKGGILPGALPDGREVGDLAWKGRSAGAAMGVDLLGVAAAAAIALVLRIGFAVGLRSMSGWKALSGLVPTSFLFLLTATVLMVTLSETRGSLQWRLHAGPADHARSLILPVAAGGLVSLGVGRLVDPLLSVTTGGSAESVNSILELCALTVATVAIARYLHTTPRRGATRRRRVVIVGSGEIARAVAERLGWDGHVQVVGYVDDWPEGPDRWLGSLRSLPDVCRTMEVDHVMVAFSASGYQSIVDALRPLQGDIPISVVPRLYELMPDNATVHDLGWGFPAVSVGPSAVGRLPRSVKRAIDLLGAGVGLALLWPLLLLIAASVRLTSPGPALLRQERIGRHGRSFAMLKFRSMIELSDDHGPASSPVNGYGGAVNGNGHLTNGSAAPPANGTEAGNRSLGPFQRVLMDRRVTPLGRFLRRSALDELPQLLNVLTGDMSLVGPRPFVPEDAACIEGWALRRYVMRPGITGLWQVSGRNDLSLEEMSRLDLLYVGCWSVGMDLRVLARTARAVLRGRGAR